MSLLEAVIMGIIQGLSEFLPVSSSGHLALFRNILRVESGDILFDVAVHVGTLVPVFIVFWDDLSALIKKPFQKTTYLLIAATIPAVLVAVLFKTAIEGLFNNMLFMIPGFTLTGILLLFADKVKPGKKTLDDVTYSDALIVGCMQAVAIAPSVSRSGSTIAGALSRKMSRETAARFGFLMSIPVILGAAVLEAKDIVTGEVLLETSSVICIIAGFAAAAMTGYLAIGFMMRLIKKAKLKYFAYYVFALAALIFVDCFILDLI